MQRRKGNSYSLREIFYVRRNSSVLLSEFEGKIIGGLLILKFRERVSAEAIGGDHHFAKAYPNHFLYWEAIKLAYFNGYRIFDFGRTSPNSYNLVDFKGLWGTDVSDLPQFFYPARHKRASDNTVSYRLLRRLIKIVPDSCQPVVGAFFDHHFG